ncbi:MAG: ABC transporter permease [Treponema sp.]|jgi:putative spermidine/putrescine transport system permease protein|nr:ABC transporter permease [Treponema sp.]
MAKQALKEKLSTVLFLIPGAGFILLFLSFAFILTVFQSFGLFSLIGESRFTLNHWKVIFEQEFIDSFLFSLKIGIGSAFGTLLFAYPLALFLRKKGFGKKLLGSLVKIPLFIPALVAAFLVVNLISYHGLVNSVLLALGIIEEPLRMLNDEFGWGVFLIQIWKNIPFQLLIISSSLAVIRNDVEDAALNLGAGRLKVIFYITIPLSIPGILVAVVLVFIMTFGDFAITKIAGPVYPNSISVRMLVEAMVFQEWNKAAVMGVIVMVTAVAFAALYTQIGKKIQENRR